MTRDEFIADLKLKARQLRVLRSVNCDCEAKGLEHAAEMAERLDSPPAMTWQDEPSGEGWYWIDCDGDSLAVFVWRGREGCWMMRHVEYGTALSGRRVCPVPAPPALPKRGDA